MDGIPEHGCATRVRLPKQIVGTIQGDDIVVLFDAIEKWLGISLIRCSERGCESSMKQKWQKDSVYHKENVQKIIIIAYYVFGIIFDHFLLWKIFVYSNWFY